MTRKLMKSIVAVLLVLVAAGWCRAQTGLPEPTGMLNDFAGKLSPGTRGQLETVLRRFRDQTQIEVTVATVNYDSMQGYPVEQYALDLARKWGVGRDSQKRAMLLLVAIKEPEGGVYHGQTRLEVSRHLEGDVPDILAGELIRRMRADFNAGRFDQALANGVQTILATLQQRLGITVDGVDPTQVVQRARRPVQTERRSSRSWLRTLMPLIVIGVVFLVIALANRNGPRGPRGGGGRRSGSVDWMLWPIIFGSFGRGHDSGWGGGSSWGGGGSGWGGSDGGGFGGFGGGGDFGGGGASDSW